MGNTVNDGTDQVIVRAETEIHRWGPRRVLIDKEGLSVSPERALRLQNQRRVDIIFIRKDGWTLGAISELADYAEQLWPTHWIAVMIRPGLRSITYADYKSFKNEQKAS